MNNFKWTKEELDDSYDMEERYKGQETTLDFILIFIFGWIYKLIDR